MRRRTKWGFAPSMLVILPAIAIMLIADKAWTEPELTYHGQFRINYYSDSRSDTSDFGDENVSAARLRWRPTFDVKVSDTVSTHMQFNIGHIKENTSNARYDNSGSDPAVALRHAVIEAVLSDGLTGVAGLVPVSDKFGDTLFSGDWDFNPLTLAFLFETGDMKWRVGTAKLVEGSEMNIEPEDDFDVYLLDVDMGPFGASVYYLINQTNRSTTDADDVTTITAIGETTLALYGVRYGVDMGAMKIDAFILASNMDDFAADHSASGFAGKIAVKMPAGGMTLGLMAIYASGDKDYGKAGADSNSFITPMSLIGHHGYWGYTGKLNIQGPTDTGIDDPVNIDGGSYGNQNLGRGLTTLQVNLAIPINSKLGAYVAGGWFASADAPDGESDDIGIDFYAQVKYNLGENLNLEAGFDYAALGEGSHMSITSDGTRKSRDVTTLFSRLQLEY